MTRAAVVATAVQIADAEGIAAVTMRKIAQQLGVEAMSLYHHVRNKDGILDVMVDHVFAEIEIPTNVVWRDALRVRMESARAALVRHPWALGLMDSRRDPGPETLRHHDAVIGVMRGAGFTIRGAAHAFSLLDSYLYGYVLQETTMPFDSADEAATREVAEAIQSGIDPADLPHLTEMTTAHVLQPGYSYADEFGIGLEVVLDGLERNRERWA
ncbi:TetR/AcrR family transcriptional regulator [Gordonia sp. PKS22-38]|uniref:TetR/AcrR family transcriptional regulator n=1 Tax=Gordonia prachuapensis TaxID=3115651 RepID=A0ABU7MV65_9ACTN|nr:TetR/AcrR family transcriptional regulator [Gordonia sp. PKS22-38]